MIQLQYICKILSSKDPTLITLNNLTDEFFSDYKDEFNYIKNHLQKYGNIPDVETFLSIFSDFDYITVTESDKYLLDALYDDRNKRVLATTFNRVRDAINSGDTERAMQIYSESSEQLMQAKHLEAVDIYKDFSRYDAYLSRTNNIENYYVTTGFPELDEVIGGWDRKEELATIVARTNTGKCLAKGTNVLMYDGTLKNVEDIAVGDKVQSFGCVNTVLSTHNGISHGYKITSKLGDEFIISDNHVLTIYEEVERWDKSKNRMITDNTFVMKDITIEEYLSYSNHKKRLCRLFYPSIDYSAKDLLIDPYIFGTWLGDGSFRAAEITTMDIEVEQAWREYAKHLGMRFVFCAEKGETKTFRISHVKGDRNYFLNCLRRYGVYRNKHIPIEYLTGSRNQRLQLLAGILDTDGSYSKKSFGYELTNKNKYFIEQVRQLVIGIGLRAGRITTKTVKGKDYYRIYIFGDFTDLPIRVEHKKPQIILSRHRNSSFSRFIVSNVESVEYYGFECDGDHRFILGNGILTHNSMILYKTALAAAEQGLTVGIYSGEMSENKVGYRIDTMLSHISNTKLTHGDISVNNDYKTFLDSVGDRLKGKILVLTPPMINGTAGVSALRAFIEKYHLDMLCVDQHSLLEDDRKARNPVERAANISKDLKNLQVMAQIPIISVSQQNREDTSEKGVDTKNIAQSDRIGQDSTVVIFLERKDSVMTLTLVKSRDSANGVKLSYNVNFDTGSWIYIPSEGDALNGNKCEDVKDEFEYSDSYEEEPF